MSMERARAYLRESGAEEWMQEIPVSSTTVVLAAETFRNRRSKKQW